MRKSFQTQGDLEGVLRAGGVAVIPTDTIYGIVGLALRPKTVARIYKVRKRSPKKPCIVLISSLDDLRKFGVRLRDFEKKVLEKVWPGKVSVILPVRSKKFRYLDRGTGGIAFRLPAVKYLRELVQKTGPLIAPSANIEGFPPAKTLGEAVRYFGARVDCYMPPGRLAKNPSTLIAIEDKKVIVVRKGAVRVPRIL
jgi:L-threonylcarbamoyladenylate synthase